MRQWKVGHAGMHHNRPVDSCISACQYIWLLDWTGISVNYLNNRSSVARYDQSIDDSVSESLQFSETFENNRIKICTRKGCNSKF